jgi:hypothetical protein
MEHVLRMIEADAAAEPVRQQSGDMAARGCVAVGQEPVDQTLHEAVGSSTASRRSGAGVVQSR